MLGVGDAIPVSVLVWVQPREGPQPLADVLGDGLVLLCFYLWDWSPT